jgi:hypothetical protein
MSTATKATWPETDPRRLDVDRLISDRHAGHRVPGRRVGKTRRQRRSGRAADWPTTVVLTIDPARQLASRSGLASQHAARGRGWAAAEPGASTHDIDAVDLR